MILSDALCEPVVQFVDQSVAEPSQTASSEPVLPVVWGISIWVLMIEIAILSKEYQPSARRCS